MTATELQASRRRRVALETYEAQAIFGLGNDGNLAAIAANGAQNQNIRRREKNRIGIWTHSLVETPGPNPVGSSHYSPEGTCGSFGDDRAPDCSS